MSIQGIIADEKNNALWLSTFEGLSRFSIDDGRFNNFSLEDGIQSLLFADASCLKTSGGLFIFGGINGITFFNPDEIERNSMPPRVFIKDFRVANVSLPYNPDEGHSGAFFNDESIRIKYFQNNISINYVGIHFANPQRNRFAYRLENYDENWREVGSQRTAYYYNLPAGEFFFKVRAANSNGIWSEEGASVKITITPPWWKSWWAYIIYCLILAMVLVAADHMQRRRVIMKERAMIRDRELKQAREIERTYRELQTTQQQLVHSEKMASLGELTAGIAHEIQNPLNFVNNFSEVSVDLLKDLETEISNENKEEAITLVTDLQQNLQKIGFHGKRASSIIKGMLEHSRANSGTKENTDLNLLALEYIRLTYHGFKAKDKSFNGYFMTDFDEELPQVRIVPQDIGRVLLNLFNNAFYAVASKSKQVKNGYSPTVTVSTKQINKRVEIRVKDNGEGIPEHLLGKIFQPFFTTKPAGEGTGLGLSISFDIITKGHLGEMKVETKEGEWTEFIITLPR
jgi:signal transduction histidine kinase